MPEKKYGANVDAPAIRVSHAQLERWSDEGDYKSKCPSCPDGLLLVMRDQSSLRVINVDRCVSCGQVVVYTDTIIGGEPVYNVHATAN